MAENKEYVPSSFRDPSGSLFYHEGILYREVRDVYKENYDFLMSSGLYKALTDAGILIPHQEIDAGRFKSDGVYKVIRPEEISFLSYPYEWSFTQLKDAALCTLRIQEMSLEYGMSLKDCSAYNIQFREGRPVFIDTLSFEKYERGTLWVAYRQFCQHFLAPLVLMGMADIRLGRLSRLFIDGIPLNLASRLLPIKARFKFPLLIHIYLHAMSQRHFADKRVKIDKGGMSHRSFLGLIDSLKGAIRRLKWQPEGTEWADYYDESNYSSDSFKHKQELVTRYLDKIKPKSVWDLGANTGLFSRIAADMGIQTISFDIDAACVERNYLDGKKRGETKILPLVLDLTNPSPDIGWESKERPSIFKRGPADTALALALIHHLAISNNVPLDKTARFFSRICKRLIIEFVPKSDSQVRRLLSTREDIFPHYTQQTFETAFKEYFKISDSTNIKGSDRILYLMEGNGRA